MIVYVWLQTPVLLAYKPSPSEKKTVTWASQEMFGDPCSAARSLQTQTVGAERGKSLRLGRLTLLSSCVLTKIG